MLLVVDDSEICNLQSTEASEANNKGHLIICVIITHIEHSGRALNNEILKILVKAAEDDIKVCLPILEKKMGQVGTDGATQGLHEMNLDTWRIWRSGTS